MVYNASTICLYNMTTEKTYQWLAAHLYYNEPWETFLLEAIQPYIHTVMRTGIAQQFFFIRYWDRGPHIRLRFKGEASVIENVLKDNLQEHFLGYFDLKPSLRTEPNYPANFPAEHKWFPNNSIQFIPYLPEQKRYGGRHALLVAEQHFEISSAAVLEYMSEKGMQWTYDDAMGTAIKLHLSFVHALGMDLVHAHAFFHFIFYNWLPHSFKFLHKKWSNKAYQAQAEETIEAFESAFEQQREALTPFHQVLWEALESNASFEEELLNKWVAANRSIKNRLLQLYERRLMDKRPAKYLMSAFPSFLDEQAQELWMYYADLLHMTNNRLGILNKDEGFLAFLMLRSLKNLIPQQPAKPPNTIR